MDEDASGVTGRESEGRRWAAWGGTAGGGQFDIAEPPPPTSSTANEGGDLTPHSHFKSQQQRAHCIREKGSGRFYTRTGPLIGERGMATLVETARGMNVRCS